MLTSSSYSYFQSFNPNSKARIGACRPARERGMRGEAAGGPLLRIGDLLADVGESSVYAADDQPRRRDQTSHLSPSSSPSSLISSQALDLQPSDLTKLFQETYDELNKALSGADHSWTSLTLKLCTILDAANKLINSTNSNVAKLLEKVEELKGIIKRGDSSIAAVRSIHSSLSQIVEPSRGGQ
ncbi:hypothetical protein Droror1_Dr00004971 [Drosera rotundifolia]